MIKGKARLREKASEPINIQLYRSGKPCLPDEPELSLEKGSLLPVLLSTVELGVED